MQSLDGTINANAGFAHLRNVDCVGNDRQLLPSHIISLVYSSAAFFSVPRAPVERICNTSPYLVLFLAYGLWL